jgi:cephalosporin hydroxylase
MNQNSEESSKVFQAEVAQNITALAGAYALRAESNRWLRDSLAYRYSYNFSWLGRPIIQYPQDIVAVQELIWRVRPDVIIETGIAHGGSLILSASILALLDYCDADRPQNAIGISKSHRRVIGIDIDIRKHNRTAIEAHPLSHKITLLEGSSIDAAIVERVREIAAASRSVMVLLDSNHTHDHVARELRAYAPLVTIGSYCVVFDTVIEHLPKEAYPNKPWAPGNNPLTAVNEFLTYAASGSLSDATGHPISFVADEQIDSKLQISSAPRGYLRRVA